MYHGIMIQVKGLDGERISKVRQCTRSQSWRSEDGWNDRVWVK
jgi:hypothetical protein